MSPRNNNTEYERTPPKMINKLEQWSNRWLLPILTLVMIPFVLWCNNAVNQNTQFHLQLVETLKNNTLAIRYEMDSKIAALPPAEWKARIIALENVTIARGEQFVRLESMLLDVKERVTRLDDARKSSPTNRSITREEPKK